MPELTAPNPEALRTAAARLVSTLAAHEDDEYRLTVLRRLARTLGEERYPLFLRLLTVVAESEDEPAKHLLADAFGAALRRMDLPGGALSSWGAARLPLPELGTQGTLDVAALSGQFFGATPRRLLGPVEYLTVWHLQRTQRIVLGTERYRDTLTRLVELFNHSEQARRLYPQKLAADAVNELEGAYTRVTRESLAAIASAWQAGRTPEQVAQAALDAGAPEHPSGWLVRDL
jgi:hypothetical protein